MKVLRLALPGAHMEIRLSRESPEDQELRETAEFRRSHIYFLGDYSSWQEALAHAKGYDDPIILEKAIAASRAVRDGLAAYERDTVIFDTAQLSYPLLFALLYAATHETGRLSVMDFGGALGSSYRQNAPFISHLESFSWGVVEQSSFVAAGKAEFESGALRFFSSVQECMEASAPNFLLLSSVLQYLEKPYEFLNDVLGKNIPYLFIDRAMAHRLKRDRLAVQHVPAWIYDASYPVWLMDADHMEAVFVDAGYEIIDCFDPHPGSTFGPPDFRAPYTGWFLRKRRGA